MQQKQYDGPPSTFVNVKRIKQGKDDKGRDKLVLTVGLNRDGRNDLDTLIDALTALRGKQANLDIRVSETQGADGRTFPTAFIRVVDMVPKSEGAGKTTFVPKNQARANNVKASAQKIRQDFGG